jgi:protein tyrosine phosphatase (PTP) superfamily phosphohydrolase (DUF442 family)
MPPPLQPTPRSPRLQFALRGVVVGLLGGLGLHFGYVLLGPNFRTVLPGQVYRCSQPSPDRLEKTIHRLGIRTVVNLRGCCLEQPWYQAQCQVVHRLGVSQEDLGFSAGRLPSVQTIRQLALVLDRAEYPILFHCHQGADRTGMASVMAILLRSGATLKEARRHLGPASGHLRIGRTGHIDQFFDLYEEWLAEDGREHTSATFRHWVHREYCPGECRAEVRLRGKVAAGYVVKACVPAPARVRVVNRSIRPWRFQPGTNAGVHAHFLLLDSASDRYLYEGRAGLFHATVWPDEHLDLTLALPALPPGRYRLRVDLVDEQHGFFLQFGSPPLFTEVEAR